MAPVFCRRQATRKEKNMPHKLSDNQISMVISHASSALFQYCKANDIHYTITGSSGGLDSAVTLGLAEQACLLAKKENYRLVSVGLIMPSHSKPEAEDLGREAIKKFNAEEIFIDLSSAFDFISHWVINSLDADIKHILKKYGDESSDEWAWSEKIASGNIKARLRMMCGSYHTARMLKGIVLSTDNLSEFWMAFWTMHGDVGDFNMIQYIMKGLELYDIARALGVPQGIINAKPDDGLGISGGDEDQLGAIYPVLDSIMVRLIQAGFDPDGSLAQLENLPELQGVNQELVIKLASRAVRGAHKRKGTVMLTREELGLPAITEIEV